MEIDRTIDKALSWIYENMQFFNPLADLADMYRQKMFAELQLVLLISNRNKQFLVESSKSLLGKLESFSEEIILSSGYYEQICLNLRNFRLFAVPVIYYLCFNKNKRIERLINRVYMQAFSISPEYIPYRLLDIEHSISLSERYTGTKIAAKMQKDVYATILNSHYDIINWGIEEEYALTHSIFYITDFGNKQLPDDLKCNAVQNIPILCYQKVIEEDLDLLGEYVMNLCNLNVLPQFRLDMYKYIAEKQTQQGYFIGPRRKGMNKLNESVSDLFIRKRNVVRNNYHTTLVAIMASILIKSRMAL